MMKMLTFGPLVVLLAAASVGCQHNLVNGGLAGNCTDCDPANVANGQSLEPQPEIQQVGHFRHIGGISDGAKPVGNFGHFGHVTGGHAGCPGCNANGGQAAGAYGDPSAMGMYGGAGYGGAGYGGAGYGAPGMMAHRRAGLPTPVARLPHHYESYMSSPANGGPPGPTYGYPYYTTRGPRDFLLDNPPSIGY